MCAVSSFSIEDCSILRPNSDRKFAPSTLIGPSVSTATGMKKYFDVSSRYLSAFWMAACSAAAPAFFEVPLMWEAAWVSGDLASQMRHFPARHGVKVTPSGLFLSDLYSPSGSLLEWMLALARDLQMMSLIKWWRSWRPAAALRLHANECVPYASTRAPQRHKWGSQSRHPSRNPTAALMTSLLILSPHVEIGRALSHAPACRAREARILARSRSLLQLANNSVFLSSMPTLTQFFCLWEAELVGWVAFIYLFILLFFLVN